MSGMLKDQGLFHFRAGPLQMLLRPRIIGLMTAGLLLLAALGFSMLPMGSFTTTTDTLKNFLFADRTGVDSTSALILGDIRLPRILMAILAGAMLGMAGAALQTLTHNPLADPGLIGVKEGASVSIILLTFFIPQSSSLLRTIAGFAGGLGVAIIVIIMARDLARTRFILIGIGVSWLLHACLSLFITMADVKNVQTALIWLAGSLHGADWQNLSITALWGLIGLILLLATAPPANANALGTPVATGLGVNIRRLTAIRLLAPVLLTASAVSAIGNLGFVGLIAPHLSRLTLGGGQVSLICGSALYGGILVLAADSIGRIIFAPLQIPAGIVMAIIGVPFLLMLLWRRRDNL